MKNTALLLVDIQKDYFAGGKMFIDNSELCEKNSLKLLTAFRQTGRPVIHVRHISTRPGSKFFLPDTEGSDIIDSLEPLKDEAVVVKHSPNSFAGTELREILDDAGIEKLVVCGMMSNMCIDATVRAAKDFGFEVITAEDACAAASLAFGSRAVASEDVHAAFMAALNGFYSRVISTDEILEELS